MSYSKCVVSLGLQGKIHHAALRHTAGQYKQNGMDGETALMQAVQDRLATLHKEHASVIAQVRSAYEADGGQPRQPKQAAAEQQGVAPATTPAAEAAPALEALNQKSDKDTPYVKRKLGDLFNQSGSIPLASVKDFISSIKSLDDIGQFLGETLNPSEKGALRTFLRTYKAWSERIDANIINRGKPEYNFEDAMQYFILPDGKIDENLKAAIAYAAFSYVAENFGKRRNTNAEINEILGLDSDAEVLGNMDILRTVVSLQSMTVDSLGKRIVAALGLKSNKDVGVNELARLQQGLGAHALRLLVDNSGELDEDGKPKQDALMERTLLDPAEFAALKGQEAKTVNSREKIALLSVKRDANGAPQALAQGIIEGSKDSKGVVSRLFTGEDAKIPPTFEPVKAKKFTKRTKMLVPSFLQDILNKLNKQENYLRTDKLDIHDAVGRDNFLTMMGVTPTDFLSAGRVDAVQAKNEGLGRELDNLMEFVHSYLAASDKGMDTPFYFEHYAMRQQRVGIANSMVNPQLSKIHRFFVYRPSWVSTVNVQDEASLNNFFLRAAEGLGISTDKLEQHAALDKFWAKYGSTEIQAGIDALIKVEAGQKLTDDEKQAIVTAVQSGGENAHSLDALQALAQYTKLGKANSALPLGQAPQTTFSVNMLAEVDGVTNGPMLSMLLMGAANTADALMNTLKRGGFFKVGEFANFNDWRSLASARDLYQQTTRSVLDTIGNLLKNRDIDQRIHDSVAFFMGKLEDKATGAIEKDGRNMIKTPLTAMVYGSSLDAAVESMAHKFIGNIYKKMESLHEKMRNGQDITAEYKQMLGHMLNLGVAVDKNIGLNDLMQLKFGSRDEQNLIQAFESTFGTAVKQTIEKDFAHLLENRKQFNEVADITFDLYDAAYTAMRNQLVEELIAQGELTATKQGTPLHDLTPAQEAELEQRMEAITPTLATVMSNLSGAPMHNTGMLAMKSDMETDTSKAYTNQVNFALPFADTGAKSLYTHGRKKVNAKPGVSLGATSTHSFDAATSLRAMMNKARGRVMEVLNLHDAHGTSVVDLKQAGYRLNQSLWDSAMEYSPAQEMYDTMIRTVNGIKDMLDDPGMPPAVLRAIADKLVEQSNHSARKQEDGSWSRRIPASNILMARALQAHALSVQTQTVQYGAMAQMGTVAQYAVEGGALNVTDAMRAKAQEKLDNLPKAMPVADVKLIREVQERLKDVLARAIKDNEGKRQEVKEKANPKLFGTIGTGTAPDPAILGYFKRNPESTVAEVMTMLGKQNLTGFQQKLLAGLSRALGNRTQTYTVRFVTKDTLASQVLERPKVPSHAWFVSKNGQNEIYVLSGDFKESNLSTEVLLHELTHAAVAHAIANPDAKTQPLINELEDLRARMQGVIQSDAKLSGFLPAVQDVQELVAWGMTNPAFQSLLDAHLMESANEQNVFVSGFRKFVDTLVGLLFGKQNSSASTAMTVLITNVAGLMTATSIYDYSGKNSINQSMAAPLASLSGAELYDELGRLHHTAVSPEFDAKLRNVLESMEQSVHSPLASMKQAALANAPQTPQELWANMGNSFSQGAAASGFRFTEQEMFAMQQVQATIAAALHNQDGGTTALYRELARLYNHAKNELKGKVNSFHADPVQAQALYDFIFKMESGLGDRSDYLSRFAALGLTNEQFSKLLDFNTPMQDKTLAGKSMGEMLHTLFEQFLNWIHARATHTFEGQKADEKLDALVKQLVDVEQRQRMKLSQSASVAVDSFESVFRSGAAKAKQTVNSVANSKFFKSSTNGIVRFTGSIVATVASDRLNLYLDGLQTFRDEHIKGRNGVLMGILNEARGAHDKNAEMHGLLRVSKYNEGVRKDLITNTSQFSMASFKDGGKHITDAMSHAISAVVLRTDVQSLLAHFDTATVMGLLKDQAKVGQQINNFETQLKQFGTLANGYRNHAEALGVFMATGKVGMENLLLNAENIARRLGTAQADTMTAEQIAKATPIIDGLATLYALKTIAQDKGSRDHLEQLAQVIDAETSRTDGGNGLELVMKLHQNLQTESRDRLFKSSGALFMKGYTPEIYNPYIRLEVADETQGKDLMARGYDMNPIPVTQAESDPDNKAKKHLYVLRDGGLVQYLTGIFSYTGQNKRGTAAHNGDLGVLSVTGLENRDKMAKIERLAAANKALQEQSPMDIRGDSQTKNFMVPVFNSDGKVVNYRYMMNRTTKDDLLERDNRFHQLLGVMAGNIFDKEASEKQNAKAVQALYDQYKADYNKNPASYIEVGPNSSDPEAKQVWNLLPESSKQSVRAIWGTNSMLVRIDHLDINFGYRKLSMAAPFGIPEHARSEAQQFFVSMMEALLGRKAELRVRQFEDIWQALVREAKDTMVVKSGVTLLGNFTSNVSELIWFGVPLTDIWKHHRVALKGVMAYRKDSTRLAELEMVLKLDQLAGRNRKDVEGEIVQLKDALSRNPVRELVEAGLMPTIVEDVAQDEDRYSYKSMLTQKVDSVVGQINPHVLQAGKYLTMAHDTPLYKALSYGTQVSDFVARYTLYQHVINRAKNPIDAKTAVQLVSDAFVNYDVPSHRTVQYANDMGLVYFSKYYLRIQKVIALLYSQNPGRAMMLLTAGHFLDFLPMLQHSAALHRVGNPFRLGAFEAVSSLDEMATINALMTPFR